MKNNRLFFLGYFLLLVVIFYFEFLEIKKDKLVLKNQNYGMEINKKIGTLFAQYLEPLKVNSRGNELWGIKEKKELESEKDKDKNKNKIIKSEIEVILKDRSLCIEKECFKLLGIFFSEGKYNVSLYNKKAKKNKIRTFLKEDIISLTIKVKKIIRNKVYFVDVNSTREWSMKMFDINSSKYKPKDFE